MDMEHFRRLIKAINTSEVGSLLWLSYHRELLELVRKEIASENAFTSKCPNSSWSCRDPHCVEHLADLLLAGRSVRRTQFSGLRRRRR